MLSKSSVSTRCQMDNAFIIKYHPFFAKDVSSDASFLGTLNMLREMDELNILFVSKPNSGKTTLLYALIYEYYELKPFEKLPENNLLFVNNLKDQGIHYFRNEMKTFSQTRSSIFGKKKMIIIDDIDWINEQCQQVFRNYLDKYHNNIHFLCVCTNQHKVIESIQSRLLVINIPPQEKSYVISRVHEIVTKEKIEIDAESIEYLLFYSQY